MFTSFMSNLGEIKQKDVYNCTSIKHKCLILYENYKKNNRQ